MFAREKKDPYARWRREEYDGTPAGAFAYSLKAHQASLVAQATKSVKPSVEPVKPSVEADQTMVTNTEKP